MRHIAFSVVTTIVLMVSANIAEAGQITYSIQNYPADQQGATLSGTITTDGVTGNLTGTDILSWSWTITPAGGTPFTLHSTDTGSATTLVGQLVASATTITMANPAQGSVNDFDLASLNSSGELTADLAYSRIPSPGANQYLALTPAGGIIWANSHPAMGGTDPWVIAVVASSVPEPSGVVLMSLAISGLLLGRNLHRSSRKHCSRLS
jgi:hypothetical protein